MRTARPRRLLITAASFIALVACGSDSATAPAATVAGNYSLMTMNGRPLPVTVFDTVDGTPVQLDLVAPYTLTLNTDLTFRAIATVRMIFAGVSQVQVDTSVGTYSISGHEVTFRQTGEDPTQGQWNGSDMLTISSAPDVLVFKK